MTKAAVFFMGLHLLLNFVVSVFVIFIFCIKQTGNDNDIHIYLEPSLHLCGEIFLKLHLARSNFLLLIKSMQFHWNVSPPLLAISVLLVFNSKWQELR